MSDGERIQKLIYGWLRRNYPEGPVWYQGHADTWPPLEIIMVPAFNDIEYNLGNGGWSQFLWNCLGYWQPIVGVARQGYDLIGAHEQSAALDTLQALCARDERECRETLERSIREDNGGFNGPPYFAEFTARSYGAKGNDWEDLFFHDSGAYEKRLAWLAANEARVREAIGMLR